MYALLVPPEDVSYKDMFKHNLQSLNVYALQNRTGPMPFSERLWEVGKDKCDKNLVCAKDAELFCYQGNPDKGTLKCAPQKASDWSPNTCADGYHEAACKTTWPELNHDASSIDNCDPSIPLHLICSGQNTTYCVKKNPEGSDDKSPNLCTSRVFTCGAAKPVSCPFVGIYPAGQG